MRLLFLAVVCLGVVSVSALEPVDFSKWNYDTGLTVTLYAYSAYCPIAMLDAWNCSYCQRNETVKNFKTTNIFQQYGERVYVGYNPDYDLIVVAFRGSQDIQNWISNINFVKEDYPYCEGCQVHKGFYELWKTFETEVCDAVNLLSKAYPTATVTTVGHSLGGALATLSGVDVLNNLETNASVYTWTIGSPRVGNKAFSDWYQNNTVGHNQRITNWHDIVPHLPNESQGFFHVPQETWEQKYPDNFVLCEANNGEDRRCSNSVLAPHSVYDHLHYFGIAEGTEYC